MQKQDAVNIIEHVERMVHHANHVLYIANNSGDADLKQRVQRALGDAVAEFDLKIVWPIYKEFPDLRPPDTP